MIKNLVQLNGKLVPTESGRIAIVCSKHSADTRDYWLLHFFDTGKSFYYTEDFFKVISKVNNINEK